MAEDQKISEGMADAFAAIANHYDDIMAHVDYARWRHVVSCLGAILPAPFVHLDAGCGTGVLIKQLADYGFQSVGLDLSPTMLRVARNRYRLQRLVHGNFCALPFSHSFSLITSLFDSMNFLLSEEDFSQAIVSFHQALKPNGILYFDVVTDRMIADHFDNTSWTENHGRFRSAWVSSFARQTQTCETRVRVNSGAESITYERVYPTTFILECLEKAGFSLLAMRDANRWWEPTKNTTRIDFIAVKGDASLYRKDFKTVDNAIKAGLGR